MVILVYEWLRRGVFDLATIIALAIAAGIILTVLKFQKIWRQILVIIGEDTWKRRSGYRFIIPLFFSMPFVFYVLLSGRQATISSALDFNIIIIAPTLGGLIFAGAASRRIKNVARVELISVVKKLIVATVLFILFSSLIFTIDLIGGINTQKPDYSITGIFRGVSFWTSAVFFYMGVFLFLSGITDLVLALRHLRK